MSPQTLVISYDPPGYSEVWMRRMTRMLSPDVSSIYARHPRRGRSPEKDCDEQFLLPRAMSALPRSLTVGCCNRWTNRLMSRLLRKTDPSTRVLVHYVTTAVCIRDSIHSSDHDVYVHCHGFDVTWHKRSEWFPWLNVHSSGYVAQVLDLARRVRFIANSQSTAKKLADIGIPDDRVVVKYIGVPASQESPSRRGNASDELTVLFLGRLTDFKGPVETIKAFALSRKNGLRGRLLLAGGGAQRSACEREIRLTGQGDYIKLIGPVSESEGQELLRKADIFTAHNQRSDRTGQEEAYGVSVVEAMAAGIPVVTGRSGGVCETVVNGETGILFAPGDIAAHADALLLLSKDVGLRQQMGLSGYRRACELFSLEREEKELKRILFGR
ncbi:MAG: glycosyltransferase family 4 protein [Planctomyces sp.]